MTDLVNPMQSVLEELNPNLERDPKIQTKLTFGKTVHIIAASWFRSLPDFVIAEGRVDGTEFGLPGVKGRIDFRLGKSIIEFKTTEERATSIGDVHANKPQDLEQLILYAILTSRSHEPHWLVYYHAGREHPFTAFQVRITEISEFMDVVSRRLGAMNRAFESSNVDELYRCHFLSSGCDLDLQGRCPCKNLPAPDMGHLTRCVEVADAPDFAEGLESARTNAVRVGRVGLSVWDLFIPRQAFLKNLGMSLGSFIGEDERYGLRRYIEESVDGSPLVTADAKLSLGETYLGRSRTFQTKETPDGGSPVRVNLPYIVRAVDWVPSDWLPPAYAAQLAVHCALRDSPEALLVLGLVKHPGELICYRYRFKDLQQIRDLISERIALISAAVKSNSPLSLPGCPKYTTDGCGLHCLCRGVDTGLPSQSQAAGRAK